ncbi:MAG: BolA family protein [Pseudohongiellaceae bacterium]
MQGEQIKDIIQQAMPDCQITVEGGDGKYLVSVVGQEFEGLNAVKRQQLIYQLLNEHITSGAIHAITMHLQTPAEAA